MLEEKKQFDPYEMISCMYWSFIGGSRFWPYLGKYQNSCFLLNFNTSTIWYFYKIIGSLKEFLYTEKQD